GSGGSRNRPCRRPGWLWLPPGCAATPCPSSSCSRRRPPKRSRTSHTGRRLGGRSPRGGSHRPARRERPSRGRPPPRPRCCALARGRPLPHSPGTCPMDRPKSHSVWMAIPIALARTSAFGTSLASHVLALLTRSFVCLLLVLEAVAH